MANNVWRCAIDRNYSSYKELKERKVVAQGWPHLGDLSKYYNKHVEELNELIDKSEKRAWFDDENSYTKEKNKIVKTFENLLFQLKPGDLVVGTEGFELKGICEIITKKYFYNDEYNYAHGIGLVDWIDINKIVEASKDDEENIKSIFQSMTHPFRKVDIHADFIFKIWSEYQNKKKIEFLKNLMNYQKQVVLTGPPGTGKTYNAQQLAISQATKKTFTDDPKTKFEALRNQGQVEIVQFHPSYNYEDFVRGIQVSTDTAGNIAYTTQNRILADMAKKAQSSNDNNYVLIIDEINRANLAAVLGELIYALEYRNESVRTPYASDGDHTINIPDNLYIIGTMNTADRSVGHIDYAVRRRFAFIPRLPDKKSLETYYNNSSNDPSLKDFATGLFDSVADLFEGNYAENRGYLAPDFFKDDVQVGHTYFMAKSCEELAMKFAYQVYPLLREYYKDGVLIPGTDGKILHYLEDGKDFSFQVDKPEDTYKILKKIQSKCEESKT